MSLIFTASSKFVIDHVMRLYFTLCLTLSHLAVKSKAHWEQWEVARHIPTLLRVGSPFILSHYTQTPCGSLHTYT